MDAAAWAEDRRLALGVTGPRVFNNLEARELTVQAKRLVEARDDAIRSLRANEEAMRDFYAHYSGPGAGPRGFPCRRASLSWAKDLLRRHKFIDPLSGEKHTMSHMKHSWGFYILKASERTLLQEIVNWLYRPGCLVTDGGGHRLTLFRNTKGAGPRQLQRGVDVEVEEGDIPGMTLAGDERFAFWFLHRDSVTSFQVVGGIVCDLGPLAVEQ